VHKFGVIALCLFLHWTFVWDITKRGINKNFVVRYISFSWSALHRNHNSVLFWSYCPLFIFTLNCVQDITLKLHEVSTRNFVGRYISLSRSAMYKIVTALLNFAVIAICSLRRLCTVPQFQDPPNAVIFFDLVKGSFVFSRSDCHLTMYMYY